MNNVSLIGRLGGEPELKTVNTKDGEKDVCQFSMATTRYKKTQWHKIIVWGKMATACNTCLFKGSMVGVNGEIQTRNFEGKDGNKVYVTEIIANNVEFLDPKRDQEETGSNEIPF